MSQIRLCQFFSDVHWSDWQPIEVLMDNAFKGLIYVVRTTEEQDLIAGWSLMFGHEICTEVDPTMTYRPNHFSFAYRFLEVQT